MLIADTSALFAFLNRRDQHNQAVVELFLAETSSIVVPVAVLSELAWMVETRVGHDAMAAFLDDCQNGGFQLVWQETDIPRTQELMRRYADLPLGFADASVIALAEGGSCRVVTTDLRHFGVVRTRKSLALFPQRKV